MRDRVAVAAGAALLGAVFACEGGAGPRVPRGAPPACPHDARDVGGACRCAPGLSVLEGACVGAREQSAYCDAPTAAPGACAMHPCPGGDAIDLATRGCAPAKTAREILARVRPIPDDLAIGCHEGRALVLHDDYVACLPMADVCPRATSWDPGSARCAPAPTCAPGEVRTERASAGDAGENGEESECVRVVFRASAPERDRGALVDVGRWSQAMLGADGGEGTARLCRPLALQPWELDVGPGGARTLALTIELLFPDNDVTQVSGRTETVDTASGQPVFGPGARAAQKALDALLVPLRSLGGASDAASATLRVRCTVRGGGTPFAFPRAIP